MKNKIFLILIFCLSFDVNSKEAKIDSVKCRLYALQTFKTETETASIQVEFKDSLPFMSLTCSKEIEEFKKCFVLYIKFPKKRWKEIERAEKNDEEGNKIYKNLKQEFMEKYMPQPDADPHGAVDFGEVEQSNYMNMSNNFSLTANSDEMN